MQPQIIFEDKYLLAINKPAGMVVNRGFGSDWTVQDWINSTQDFLLAHDFELRNGIVHRLDKETSGVLLIAKTPEVFHKLQGQFKKREVEKVYLALVHGKVESPEGVISVHTGRLPWNRRRFGVLERGREAETRYRAISNFKFQISNSGQKFTLLEIRPLTGRTHQIRIHLKHIGHPIVSDPLYAGRKTNREDRKWCPRLFLHAKSLTFTHPASGQRMTVEAPMPEELQTVVNNLV